MATDIYQGRKGSITGEILNFRDSGAVRSDAATSLTEAQQAQARANIGAGASNRNLLDNGWFTVNQRGQASYSTHQGMTVDRWRLYSYSSDGTVITPTSDGITIAFGSNGGDALYQVVPIELMENGETYTLSAKMQDGTIESTTFVFTAGGAAIIIYATDFRFHIIQSWGNNIMLGILNKSNAPTTVSFRAIKLEKGSYSTLAMDSVPSYAEELARCKWFFFRVYTSVSPSVIGTGFIVNATGARLLIPAPKMRIAPTVSVSGSVFNLIYNGTYKTLGSGTISVVESTASGIVIQVYRSQADLTQNEAVVLQSGAVGNYINFSADLN